MADIAAFNPGFAGVRPLDEPTDLHQPQTPNPQLSASAGIPVGGTLSTPTLATSPEPFSKQENVSLDQATKEYKLNGADANRWGYLERMSVNVGRAHPTDGVQLKQHVDTLQNKLSGNSADVTAYGQHIERLEANPWSKVPFSDHNKELSWARTMLTRATNNLNSTRAEIDAFLSRPENLPYYSNAIEQPRR